MPMPLSTSARPTGSDAECPWTLLRPRAGSSERPAQGHVDAQTTLGLLLFQNGNRIGGLRWLKSRRKGRAAGDAGLWTASTTATASPGPVLGYAYISRAAAQGLPAAKDTLAQLDQIMPLEDRKKGVALAIAKAKTTPAPTPGPTKTNQTSQTGCESSAGRSENRAACRQTQPANRLPWRSAAGGSNSARFSQRSSAEALFRKFSGNGSLAGRQAY